MNMGRAAAGMNKPLPPLNYLLLASLSTPLNNYDMRRELMYLTLVAAVSITDIVTLVTFRTLNTLQMVH
jgi:hypothetical protein